jgi:hypothetical protein
MIKNRSGEAIDEEENRYKCLILELKWHSSMRKEGRLTSTM